MNVSISAPVFDLNGSVWLANVEADGLMAFERRNNRIPTLDGGAVIPDFGYSVADRTFNIIWPANSEAAVQTIIRLAKTYSRLIVSTKEGCFLGAPGQFSVSGDEAQFQILIQKRIDQ